jgi:hypothetical protein
MDPRVRVIMEHPIARDPQWREAVRNSPSGNVCFVFKWQGRHAYQLADAGAEARRLHQVCLRAADDGVVGVISRDPL